MYIHVYVYICTLGQSAHSARALGPCGLGPCGRPWPLYLVGPLGPWGPPLALVGQALVGASGLLWASLAPWALRGRALVGFPLGPYGPAPWATWALMGSGPGIIPPVLQT